MTSEERCAWEPSPELAASLTEANNKATMATSNLANTHSILIVCMIGRPTQELAGGHHTLACSSVTSHLANTNRFGIAGNSSGAFKIFPVLSR